MEKNYWVRSASDHDWSPPNSPARKELSMLDWGKVGFVVELLTLKIDI
jgi:hypothetical protein